MIRIKIFKYIIEVLSGNNKNNINKNDLLWIPPIRGDSLSEVRVTLHQVAHEHLTLYIRSQRRIALFAHADISGRILEVLVDVAETLPGLLLVTFIIAFNFIPKSRLKIEKE
jgi:hypothetical protein